MHTIDVVWAQRLLRELHEFQREHRWPGCPVLKVIDGGVNDKASIKPPASVAVWPGQRATE